MVDSSRLLIHFNGPTYLDYVALFNIETKHFNKAKLLSGSIVEAPELPPVHPLSAMLTQKLAQAVKIKSSTLRLWTPDEEETPVPIAATIRRFTPDPSRGFEPVATMRDMHCLGNTEVIFSVSAGKFLGEDRVSSIVIYDWVKHTKRVLSFEKTSQKEGAQLIGAKQTEDRNAEIYLAYAPAKDQERNIYTVPYRTDAELYLPNLVIRDLKKNYTFSPEIIADECLSAWTD